MKVSDVGVTEDPVSVLRHHPTRGLHYRPRDDTGRGRRMCVKVMSWYDDEWGYARKCAPISMAQNGPLEPALSPLE